MNIDALIYDCNSRAKNLFGFWFNVTHGSIESSGIGHSIWLTQHLAAVMRDIINTMRNE